MWNTVIFLKSVESAQRAYFHENTQSVPYFPIKVKTHAYSWKFGEYQYKM